MRTDLQAQSAVVGVYTNIGLRRANQRDAMCHGRRHLMRAPRAAQDMPLQHHAVAAKIDDRNGADVIGSHIFEHAPFRRYFESRSGKLANTLCTMPGVSNCGSTTGAVEPGCELYTT